MQWVPYLAQGFTAKQILDFIGRAYPSIGNAAYEAQQAGKTADDVFSWLRKFKEPELKKLNESYAHRSKENYLLRSNEATEKAGANLQPLAMGALGLGAGALLSRGIPALARSGVGQQIGEAIMGKKEPALDNLPQPSSGTIAAAQPEEKQGMDVGKIVDQLGIGPIIDNLRKAGNNNHQIRAGVEVGLKPTIKKAYDVLVKNGQAPHLEKVIEEYLKSSPEGSAAEQPSDQISEQQDVEHIPDQEPEQEKAETPTEKPVIKKGVEVMTHSGIVGQIAAENGKMALVDDGQHFHKVPVDQIQQVPEDYHNIQFDLSKVPESKRSGALAYVIANEDNTSLFVRYFKGLKPTIYQYFRKDGQPISQSILERIEKGLDTPITSGISFGGSWTQQEADSRGSANFKEISSKAEPRPPRRQPEEDEDEHTHAEKFTGNPEGDPTKDLWFVKINPIFTHGYMEMSDAAIREAEKRWDRAHARPRKPAEPETPKNTNRRKRRKKST